MRLAHCLSLSLVWTLAAITPVAALAQDDEAAAVAEKADGYLTPAAPAEDDEVATAPAGDDEVAAAPSSASSGYEFGSARHGKTAKLGKYRLRIAAAKPTFNDGLKFYDELYGDTKWYPTLVTDWYLFDWYATIGLTFRGGYYTADGYTAKQITKDAGDIEVADIEKNYNGPATLTLIPLQVGVSISFAPLARKWLVIDGWVGAERMYWQEVRTVKDETAAAGTGAATSVMMLAEAASEPEDDTLTNRGWKNASVLGASANILLNWMDGETANSLRGTMGFGFVYLTPFMEIVRTTSKEGVSFGRSVVGMGFTFETVN